MSFVKKCENCVVLNAVFVSSASKEKKTAVTTYKDM